MSQTLDAIKLVGRTVFGIYWQTPMAEALGISGRTISRWLNGHTASPGDRHDDRDEESKLPLWIRLEELLVEHERALAKAQQRFNRLRQQAGMMEREDA